MFSSDPAFPRPAQHIDNFGTGDPGHPGMSYRDWLAGQAMTALIAAGSPIGEATKLMWEFADRAEAVRENRQTEFGQIKRNEARLISELCELKRVVNRELRERLPRHRWAESVEGIEKGLLALPEAKEEVGDE